jgi:hypothetical protein
VSAEVYAEDGYYSVIPEWVLDSDVSAQAIRLYAVLRRYADQRTGHAHPSRRTLADRLQVADVKVVDRALADLTRIGAVSVYARQDEAGDRSSNGYILRRAPAPGGGGSDATTLGHDLGGRGPNATTPGRENPNRPPLSTPTVGVERGEEPQPGNHSQEPQLTLDVVEADHFAEFWTVYPRKVGKVAARKAWTSATKRVNPDKIIAAVREYPFRDDLTYVPHPASWLNGGRWEDDPNAVNPARNGHRAGPLAQIPTDPDAFRGGF